jgi:hypothetical protein
MTLTFFAWANLFSLMALTCKGKKDQILVTFVLSNRNLNIVHRKQLRVLIRDFLVLLFHPQLIFHVFIVFHAKSM